MATAENIKTENCTVTQVDNLIHLDCECFYSFAVETAFVVSTSHIMQPCPNCDIVHTIYCKEA